jgi:lipid-A-disaccharide synthase-like uncharacterized protein
VKLLTTTHVWIVFGLFAQFVFFVRFIVQWIASEHAGRSVVPNSFWYISIAGTVLITVYSVHIKDIVFVIASLLSLLIYVRNLILEKRHRSKYATTHGSEEIGVL